MISKNTLIYKPYKLCYGYLPYPMYCWWNISVFLEVNHHTARQYNTNNYINILKYYKCTLQYILYSNSGFQLKWRWELFINWADMFNQFYTYQIISYLCTNSWIILLLEHDFINLPMLFTYLYRSLSSIVRVHPKEQCPIATSY